MRGNQGSSGSRQMQILWISNRRV